VACPLRWHLTQAALSLRGRQALPYCIVACTCQHHIPLSPPYPECRHNEQSAADSCAIFNHANISNQCSHNRAVNALLHLQTCTMLTKWRPRTAGHHRVPHLPSKHVSSEQIAGAHTHPVVWWGKFHIPTWQPGSAPGPRGPSEKTASGGSQTQVAVALR
jgi:hypothetical protein